jgi:MFS transporter, AAHS family, 4-hydroxybenzoate transporter
MMSSAPRALDRTSTALLQRIGEQVYSSAWPVEDLISRPFGKKNILGGSAMMQAPAAAADMSVTGHVDVAHFIDRQPVSWYQVRLLLICGAVLFMDGYDTQAIGYVAPAIANDWKLARSALGPVFSAGLFGLMIGALMLSPVADRIGRRMIIIISTAVFGLGALATVIAWDIQSLLIIRFLTGLGLGGAMPNGIALMSEFSPHRRRATLVMIMFSGFSIGAAIGGLLAAALIPAFGWRSVFLVGGAVPVLLLPLLLVALPESVRFLALKRPGDPRIAALLGKVFPPADIAAGTRFGAYEPKLAGLPVAHLFTQGRSAATLAFWVLFFMSLVDLFLLANWLPTIVNGLGASLSTSAAIGSLLQVGGVLGTFILGRFIDRFSFSALSLTYFFATLAIASIGFASVSLVLVAAAIFCAGFCVVGGQTAANALTATFYPTALRSTGVGWALGIGRVGSIVGPMVGGIMLARNLDNQSLFLSAAAPAFVACLAAFALTRLTQRPAADSANSTAAAILEGAGN